MLARTDQTTATSEARSRDLDAAETALRRAAALKPDSMGTHLHLGRVLARKGQVDDAETQLRRAIELCPGVPLLSPMTRPQVIFTAAADYSAGLIARVTLGLVLEAKGDWSAAQDFYQRAAAMLVPLSGLSPLAHEEWDALAARAFCNLGKTFYEHEAKDAEAEEAFIHAVQLDALISEAIEYHGLVQLAQAYTAKRRGDKANATQHFRALLT